MKSDKWPLLLVALGLVVAGLVCGTLPSDEQQERTVAATTSGASTDDPTQEETDPTDGLEPTEELEPTKVLTTDVLELTLTPEIEGLVPVGTHLVGTDIEPGIYVWLPSDSTFGSCLWKLLSDLSGNTEAVIGGHNRDSRFYVEVLETDYALRTYCELLPIDAVPAPEQPLTEIVPGMYIVGRDIEAGTWRGQVAEDQTPCYWERLSCVRGNIHCVIANGIGEGQFFIEVAPSDFALDIRCPVQKVE